MISRIARSPDDARAPRGYDDYDERVDRDELRFHTEAA